ncbi:MAG: protein kinase [Deltaproteobacteria bacterium]|nr:protein kinase [Deltaproteobacteria bacterium]
MFRPVQFGKYYLSERIAVGGMAEIFKAKLYGVSGFEKPMVVKQILPQYSRNTEFIKMFIDEAKIAVSLTHGNIVPVYELGRIDGIYFIAMEYVHGKNLAEILETARSRGLPVSVEHAVYIAIEVCKGLDYAHRRTDAQGQPMGVVHRDIAPPNVIVSTEGEVKLADFGIAKAAHKLGNTEAGVVKGTYGYMSPEQVAGSPVDPRTDIFSVGILLHELLTGRRLFSASTELEAIDQVREARVPAPSSVNPKVPAAVDPIVFKALAKEAKNRYQEANELQLALSRFLFTAGGGATASTLSRYMRQLFPETPEPILEEETRAERPGTGKAAKPKPPNSTQSYAVRAEFEEATAVHDHPSAALLEAATGPAGRPSNGGAEDSHEGGDALEEFGREGSSYEEEAQTHVFSSPRGLQRPEVPELRFAAKPARDGGNGGPASAPTTPPAAPAGPAPGATLFLSSGKLASDGAASPAALRPAATGPGTAPPARATPTAAATAATETVSASASAAREAPPPAPSESGLFSIMGQGGASVMAPIPKRDDPSFPHLGDRSDPSFASAPGSRSDEVALPPKPSNRSGSGLLSSTMRLLVEGIGDDEGRPHLDPRATGRSASFDATGDESQELDAPARTIKPTTLGWIVILLVVLGSAAFVVYKKTNLLRSEAPEEAGALKVGDIKSSTEETELRGDVVLAAQPEGAAIFLHVGDTPVEVEALDQGQSHLLRLEREGYRTGHRLVKSADLAPGKTEVSVSLEPVGAGAKDEAPGELPPSGPPTGKTATVKVTSDPPSASVWLFVGKGQAELKNVASKRYYFKVMLAGHEPAFVSVLKSEFKTNGETLRRTAKLDPAAGGATPTRADAGSGSTSVAADAKAAPAAESESADRKDPSPAAVSPEAIEPRKRGGRRRTPRPSPAPEVSKPVKAQKPAKAVKPAKVVKPAKTAPPAKAPAKGPAKLAAPPAVKPQPKPAGKAGPGGMKVPGWAD